MLCSNGENLVFYCPGCKHVHVVPVKGTAQRAWKFNFDLEKPTLSPSVLNRTGSFAQPGFIDPPGIPPTICHLFVNNGVIEFLSDCTHEFKSRKVEIPDYDFKNFSC